MTGWKALTELLSVARKLERLDLVLADEVTQPRLSKPDAHPNFARQVPRQLLGRRVDLLLVLLLGGHGRG